MFTIYDGRSEFYQWDINRKLIVNNADIKEVHFCNKTDDCSLVCEVYEEEEKRVVNVPNILLQMDWRITAYAYVDEFTLYSKCFNVVKRSKPADYVYTETEVKSFEALAEYQKVIKVNTSQHAMTVGDIKSNKALGIYSVAEGFNTQAIESTAHAEGYQSIAQGYASHAENWGCKAFGHSSHAEGNGTQATGMTAHAEGKQTLASGESSHAQGSYTKATGNNTHAEGYETQATAGNAHAEGARTIASGESSHAEGYQTTASGRGAHAQGRVTTAAGNEAHAEGWHTIANGDCQHAAGQYNIEDNGTNTVTQFKKGKYIYIAGNGTAKKQSNAYTLDWDGNGWYQGTVEATGIILTSPNGTRYKVTVNDDGTLKTAKA